MLYIGIDPGQDGGIAVIDKDKKIWYIAKYDDLNLWNLFHKVYTNISIKVCIEDVHAIQGSKASSTFKFGFNVGKTYGILIAAGIEPYKVTPQIWKASFDLLYGREYDKETKKQASIDKAKKLFPGVILKAGTRSIREHDGMAEALLIAEWFRQNEGNER